MLNQIMTALETPRRESQPKGLGITRFRGQAGDTVTVSATRDPFAEIAVVSLPPGVAAVLQPRAIAGVL